MKKLMIAAAIVCAAAFAQAGSVKWMSSYLNVYGQSGDDADVVDGMAVYLMDNATVSQAAFLTALADAGTEWQSAFNTKVGSAYNSASQLEAGLANPAKGDVKGAAIVSDTAAANQALYMVMLDSANNAVYMSELVSKSILDVGDTSFSFGHDGAYEGATYKFTDGVQTDGGYFTAAAVPEPTSGLLLLLGVAGLALRRRRA